ncbi:MAG: hypothetical protein AAF590_04195 [Pseudomonadota bacterium]
MVGVDEAQPQGCSTFAAGAILLLACFSLLLFGLFYAAFGHERRQCVALPNGLNLGYSAMFDITDPWFQPRGTIKFPSGKPLIAEYPSFVFVSDTTAFGATFAWRADTGVVLQRDDQETFDQIIAEAGPLNYGSDISLFNPDILPLDHPDSTRFRPTSYGPIRLMEVLADMPRFEMERCRTRLFRFKP